MRKDDPRFINKWHWLLDEDGQAQFSDLDGVIFVEYLKDCITWERPEHEYQGEHPKAPSLFVWLLLIALGVIFGCAIQELARLF